MLSNVCNSLPRLYSLHWTMSRNMGETYDEKIAIAKVSGETDTGAGFAGAQFKITPSGGKMFFMYMGYRAGEVQAEESGGGPCNGNGQGSGVCYSAASHGTFQEYDFDGNGLLDRSDYSNLRAATRKQVLEVCDLNGDGICNVSP